ncbi:MAG: lipopolysaccharide transport periplasmic protein LptA, partial [Steroidobacteraceae bacterium]
PGPEGVDHRLVVVMLLGGWLSAIAPVAAAPPAAEPRTTSGSLVVETAFSHVDYKTDTATFKDVAVSQGDTQVTAEQARASGLSFRNSTWTFQGNVIIVVRPQYTLRCDRASVEFHDSRVRRATATGKPAVFERQRTGTRPAVHGQADKIVYDPKGDTVRLSGRASLSDGRDERISGPLLIYSIRDEKLEALSPTGSQRVRITVGPRALHLSAPKPPLP